MQPILGNGGGNAMNHTVSIPHDDLMRQTILERLRMLQEMNKVAIGLHIQVVVYVEGNPVNPITVMNVTLFLNSLGLTHYQDTNDTIIRTFELYIAGTLQQYDPLVIPHHCKLKANWNHAGYSLELLPQFTRDNGITQFPV